MNIKLLADQDIFQKAIADAEKIGNQSKLEGLNSPLDVALTGRFDEAWDEIKEMLKKAFDEGREKSIVLCEQAQMRAEQLIRDAGSKSRVVEKLLVSRLRQFQASFTDGMLEQVKSEIKVGSSTMNISQVQLNQKITLSGSVKTSLAEAFALSSAGEIQLTATYTNPAVVKVA